MSGKAAKDACRLCAGSASYAFSATIMGRREIDYFACGDCGSLQTETPTWLDEAYSLHLGLLDCGAVQRNLDNAAACILVARLWRLRDALDYGGGDGMLTRLLRDYGVNCFVVDKYAAPTYAQGFSVPDFTQPQMLFSFEVFEHFDSPASQLKELFDRRPLLFLSSTSLYRGQKANWPYLSLRSGRHVFFYGVEAMHRVAANYGYRAIVSGPYILFLRADVPGGWRLRAFTVFTRYRSLRLLRAILLTRRARGSLRDVQRLAALPIS